MANRRCIRIQGDVKDLLNEIDEDDTFTKIMDKLTVYPVMKIRICGRIF